MDGPPEELLDVFDLCDAPAHGPEVTDSIGDPSRPPRPGLLDRWPWWRTADRRGRRLAATAAVAALAAAFLGIAAARTGVRTREVTAYRIIAPAPVAVDAIGCPAGRTCAVRPMAASRLAAVRRAIPSATVPTSSETYDVRSATVYRRTLVAKATSTTLWLDTQCVPGASAVTESPMTLRVTDGTRSTYVDPGQIGPPGTRHLSATIAGDTGCSLFVQAISTVPTDLLEGLPLDYRVRLLVGDPAMMVTP